MSAIADILPTLDQVGRLLRARTTDSNSVEQVTFTAATRPTATQATATIADAAADVSRKVGATVPDDVDEETTRVVAIRAAMLIELAGQPEQVRGDTSIYEELKALYDEALTELFESIERLGADLTLGTADDTSTGGLPSFGIPDLGVPARHAPGSELERPITSVWMDW